MMPTKNGDRPRFSDASVIDPTRISDITPTATPAMASMVTERRTDQAAPPWSASSWAGLNRSRWVLREKTSPAA
jgi:hypothetical protein